MVTNLYSPTERAYVAYCKRQADARALLLLVCTTVIEEVHPSQFTCLPPSPEELVRKANMIGLITSADYLRISSLV